MESHYSTRKKSGRSVSYCLVTCRNDSQTQHSIWNRSVIVPIHRFLLLSAFNVIQCSVSIVQTMIGLFEASTVDSLPCVGRKPRSVVCCCCWSVFWPWQKSSSQGKWSAMASFTRSTTCKTWFSILSVRPKLGPSLKCLVAIAGTTMLSLSLSHTQTWRPVGTCSWKKAKHNGKEKHPGHCNRSLTQRKLYNFQLYTRIYSITNINDARNLIFRRQRATAGELRLCRSPVGFTQKCSERWKSFLCVWMERIQVERNTEIIAHATTSTIPLKYQPVCEWVQKSWRESWNHVQSSSTDVIRNKDRWISIPAHVIPSVCRHVLASSTTLHNFSSHRSISLTFPPSLTFLFCYRRPYKFSLKHSESNYSPCTLWSVVIFCFNSNWVR